MQQGSAEVALQAGPQSGSALRRSWRVASTRVAETGTVRPSTLYGRHRCLAIWQWTHSIGSEAIKGRAPVSIFIQGDPERIKVAPGIDRRFIRPVCSGAM